MDESIFDKLFELFQAPGPINWRLAGEVRKSVAGAAEPIEPQLAEEYLELALAAHMRLAPVSHLELSTPGNLRPVDGATWAELNGESFRYALEPLAGKLGMGSLVDPSSPLSSMLAPMGPAILGMQAGTMVGFMAHRVLGQFDTGLPALDQDDLFLVVPNVEQFATEHSLDPRQVRLWAVAHEVAHNALVDLGWLSDHVRSTLEAYLGSVSFDPSKLTDALSGIEDPSQIEAIAGGSSGMAELLGAESDTSLLAPVQAALAVIEGYGDHLVRRATADILPQLDQLEESAARRRAEPDQAEQFLQQLTGLSLERHRARDAAGFFTEIERRWGEGTPDKVWSGPDALPTLEELADPVGWAARVLLT